jgi:hypothetical protein
MIVFTTSAPTGATVGGPPYTPMAKGGASDNAVTFTIDGSSDADVCSINSGVVSFMAVGSCVIAANQEGNANYTAATPVKQRVAVSAP